MSWFDAYSEASVATPSESYVGSPNNVQ